MRRHQRPPRPPHPRTSPRKTEARPTGLPAGITWTFNFDAGWGTFGFANSLYDNPKEPGVDENLSDQWFEGYVKPALSATYTTRIVERDLRQGERRRRAHLRIGARGFRRRTSRRSGPRTLYLGWRSGNSLTIGENALDFTFGRAQYRLGHGFLLWDGAAEGGTAAATGPTRARRSSSRRSAASSPVRTRSKSSISTRTSSTESDTRQPPVGRQLRVSRSASDHDARRDLHEVVCRRRGAAGTRRAERLQPAGLHGADRRTCPICRSSSSTRRSETASALDSNAWTLQGAMSSATSAGSRSSPTATRSSKATIPRPRRTRAFDPLFLGFYDWGTWWQGEIAGEYFLSNSNMISHLFRAHVTPQRSIGAGLLFFKFTLDQPQRSAPGDRRRTSRFEIDALHGLEAELPTSRSASSAPSRIREGGRSKQLGRTKNFAYGMVYVGYSFGSRRAR